MAEGFSQMTEEEFLENIQQELEDAIDDDNSDKDYEPVQKKKRRVKIITPELCFDLDRVKLSNRMAARVCASMAISLGYSLEDIVLSPQSIGKTRNANRLQAAERMKDSFIPTVPLTVHWDGKQMDDLVLRNQKIDRLPVLVTGYEVDKLLGIPSLKHGSGEEQSQAIMQLLDSWNLKENIAAMCFDTTSANTGPSNGACTLLERKLDKTLLYCACRHHIYEIILKAVFEKCMGSTSGPDELMFKRFKNEWYSMKDRKFEPIDSSFLTNKQRETILESAHQHLKSCSTLRGDYQELLELVIISLGSEPEKGIRFRAPGAVSHARWMAKAIYALKIYMFRHSFNLGKRDVEGLEQVCRFVICLYQDKWFKASYSVGAPRNDLEFLQSLYCCTFLRDDVLKVARDKMEKHLWYLSEEMIGLSFFDPEVSFECKRKMVQAIKDRSSCNSNLRRFTEPLDRKIEKIELLTVDLFVSKNTINFFKKLEIKLDFLDYEPDSWHERDDFQHGLRIA